MDCFAPAALAMTTGGLLAIRGCCLKVEADAGHAEEAGFFFDDGASAPVKAEILAVNEPRAPKAIVPASLVTGADYALKVVTQSPARSKGSLLKNLREVHS